MFGVHRTDELLSGGCQGLGAAGRGEMLVNGRLSFARRKSSADLLHSDVNTLFTIALPTEKLLKWQIFYYVGLKTNQ